MLISDLPVFDLIGPLHSINVCLSSAVLRGYLPVFDLIGPLHSINVHADFVLDMRRWGGGPGVHIQEDEPRPELVLLQ